MIRRRGYWNHESFSNCGHRDTTDCTNAEQGHIVYCFVLSTEDDKQYCDDGVLAAYVFKFI